MRWIARILLCACLVIAAFFCLLWTRNLAVLEFSISMQLSMYIAGLAMFTLVVFAWLLIWRGMVRWTPGRKLATSVVAVSAQPVGFVLGLILSGRDKDFGWFLCAVMPSLLFVVGTTAVWVPIPRFRRRRDVDPTLRVPCPDCGYNLRGLTEARCPECGGQFTLEQLIIVKPD